MVGLKQVLDIAQLCFTLSRNIFGIFAYKIDGNVTFWWEASFFLLYNPFLRSLYFSTMKKLPLVLVLERLNYIVKVTQSCSYVLMTYFTFDYKQHFNK